MEAELEEERKQRAAAVNGRKKLEGDFKDMEQQVEMAQKVKEDAVKQLRRVQQQLKDYQREVDLNWNTELQNFHGEVNGWSNSAMHVR